MIAERRGMDSLPQVLDLFRYHFLCRCFDLPAVSLRAKLRAKACVSRSEDVEGVIILLDSRLLRPEADLPF